MNPRLILLIAGVVSLCFTVDNPQIYAADRPHVLVITADDMGLETNAYGQDYIPTPQMDRLASLGVIFDHAYVPQSSCSSSRAAMFTGMYPHQTGQWGLEHLGFKMKAGVPILPNLLKKSGYRTAIMGKLHVGSETPFEITELEEDLDRSRWMRRTRHVKRVSERVADFIKQEPDVPAFVKISYLDPHRPWDRQIAGLPEQPLEVQQTPLLSYDPDQTNQWYIRQQANGYLNNMKRLDVGIGMLIDQLQADGLFDNTVIIFFGDNGPPLDRAKGTSWEAGVRVPMIMTWPAGNVPQNQRSNAIVSTMDIFSTVAEITGIEVPQEVPSRSFLDHVRNPNTEFRDLAFTEMNFHGTDAYRPWRTVSDRRHKVHFRYDLQGNRTVTLYDVVEDPMEQNDLSHNEDLQSVKQTLVTRLEAWQEETNDPFVHPEFLEDFARLGLTMEEVEATKPYVPKHSPLRTKPSANQTYADWFIANHIQR